MNRRLNDTREHINDLEDKIMKVAQSEQQTERQMKIIKATYKINGITLNMLTFTLQGFWKETRERWV